MGILKAFFGALLGRLLAEEVKAWIPSLNEHLLKLAISRLPIDLRERYHEEWAADLGSYPGALAKTLRALGIVCASVSITSSPLAGFRAVFVCLFADRQTSVRTAILYLANVAPIFVVHFKYGIPIPWLRLTIASLFVSVPFLYVMQRWFGKASKRSTTSD